MTTEQNENSATEGRSDLEGVVGRHLLTRQGKRRVYVGLEFTAAGRDWRVSEKEFGARWLCTSTDRCRQGYFSSDDIRAALSSNGQAVPRA